MESFFNDLRIAPASLRFQWEIFFFFKFHALIITRNLHILLYLQQIPDTFIRFIRLWAIQKQIYSIDTETLLLLILKADIRHFSHTILVEYFEPPVINNATGVQPNLLYLDAETVPLFFCLHTNINIFNLYCHIRQYFFLHLRFPILLPKHLFILLLKQFL